MFVKLLSGYVKKNKFLFFILFPAITLLVVIFLFPIVSELRPLASAIYNFNKVRENTGSILNALLSNRVFFYKIILSKVVLLLFYASRFELVFD